MHNAQCKYDEIEFEPKKKQKKMVRRVRICIWKPLGEDVAQVNLRVFLVRIAYLWLWLGFDVIY